MGYTNMDHNINESQEWFDVDVTQQNIDECSPLSPYFCAICYSLRRTNDGWVHVSEDSIVIDSIVYECSPELWDWQNDMIMKGKSEVSPITVEFDAVLKVAKLAEEL